MTGPGRNTMEANRKFIEDVIDLHDNFGRDVDQIMFSLNMIYEPGEEEK